MSIKRVSTVLGISAIGCMVALTIGSAMPSSTADPSGDTGSSGAATPDRSPHLYSPTMPALGGDCPDAEMACAEGQVH